MVKNRRILLPALMLPALILLGGCGKTGGTGGGERADGDTSYALGMFTGSQLKTFGVRFNYDEFLKGFRAFIEEEETRLTMDEAWEKIQTLYLNNLSEENKRNEEAGRLFLAENGRKAGVFTTSSGLQYEVITQGNGAKPEAASRVRVNYEGQLLDGTGFDSSYEREMPAEFALNQVIPGWTEGIQLMNEGSTYRFFIPPELAYGESGAGDRIPPYSTLTFKVDLLSVLE
ncbi:MAG: FKBP-type peptidyl-prolyl cis-trans isomerase [Treponema sp.]|jgi:FKBP-type peptidyl-prolyl cis-trans isomerase|nr:FKBP-type peptidyl-prolyl cis-trans isomerase [Treponema sp.]